MSAHEHALVPEDPSDGDVFKCGCGYACQYVVLDDGYAEWVETAPDPTAATDRSTGPSAGSEKA